MSETHTISHCSSDLPSLLVSHDFISGQSKSQSWLAWLIWFRHLELRLPYLLIMTLMLSSRPQFPHLQGGARHSPTAGTRPPLHWFQGRNSSTTSLSGLSLPFSTFPPQEEGAGYLILWVWRNRGILLCFLFWHGICKQSADCFSAFTLCADPRTDSPSSKAWLFESCQGQWQGSPSFMWLECCSPSWLVSHWASLPNSLWQHFRKE